MQFCDFHILKRGRIFFFRENSSSFYYILFVCESEVNIIVPRHLMSDTMPKAIECHKELLQAHGKCNFSASFPFFNDSKFYDEEQNELS